MRILIPSPDSAEKQSLVNILELGGHLVVDEFPSYTIYIEPGNETVVDSPDSMFGRLAVFRIGELTSSPVNVQVSGGNLDDHALVVTVAPADIEAVCVGILRAVDQTKQFTSTKNKVVADANSELFVNLWEAIKDEQAAFLKTQQESYESHLVQVEAQLNSQSQALSKEVFAKLDKVNENLLAEVRNGANTVTSNIQFAAKNISRHLVDHTTETKRELFADLMSYYTRKRWWEFWKR